MLVTCVLVADVVLSPIVVVDSSVSISPGTYCFFNSLLSSPSSSIVLTDLNLLSPLNFSNLGAGITSLSNLSVLDLYQCQTPQEGRHEDWSV